MKDRASKVAISTFPMAEAYYIGMTGWAGRLVRMYGGFVPLAWLMAQFYYVGVAQQPSDQEGQQRT
jgi:hypothetical protein